MMTLSLLLAVLLFAARREWVLMAPERAAARRARHLWAAMDAAMTDDHACSVCRAVAPIRELVPLADGACVACLSCAALLKPTKVAA